MVRIKKAIQGSAPLREFRVTFVALVVFGPPCLTPSLVVVAGISHVPGAGAFPCSRLPFLRCPLAACIGRIQRARGYEGGLKRFSERSAERIVVVSREPASPLGVNQNIRRVSSCS